MKQSIFLFLISLSLSAQVKGVVKDSISGEPIPFVNIWVENENIGTTSEKNGSFKLDIKEEKVLIFSALGYETRMIKSTKVESVYLTQKVIQLEEIVLEIPKQTKEIEIGDAKKIHHKLLSGDKPWIYGKLFSYKEEYNKTLFLKNIIFYSDSEVKNAKLKIRIFEVKDSVPTDDLLYEDVIVSVKKGMKKNKLDVSKYNIKIPKSGFLIGLEWLIIDENKYDFTYTEKKIKKSFIYYAPSLIVNYSEEESAYHYSGGKWIKSKKYDSKQNKPWDKKVIVPAINITLTN